MAIVLVKRPQYGRRKSAEQEYRCCTSQKPSTLPANVWRARVWPSYETKALNITDKCLEGQSMAIVLVKRPQYGWRKSADQEYRCCTSQKPSTLPANVWRARVWPSYETKALNITDKCLESQSMLSYLSKALNIAAKICRARIGRVRTPT